MRKTKTSPQLRHADKRLHEWATWRNLFLTGEINHSQKNILHSWIKYGIKTRKNFRANDFTNNKAEQIDEMLNALEKQESQMIKVIRRHYTEIGTIRGKAATLGLPKSTYHDYVQRGKKLIAYKLLYERRH